MIAPEQRRIRTTERLRGLGIPVLDTLPCIESATEVRLRQPGEVVRRVLLITIVADVGFFGDTGDDAFDVASLKSAGLWDHASPKEQAFLDGRNRSPSDIKAATWQIERAVPLLWSLSKLAELPLPRQQSEVQAINDIVYGDAFEEVEGCQLRGVEEILDESDYIYRLHWATRDAILRFQEPPAGLDAGVIAEWHHAINWLTCYNDQEWDEVSTDT